MTNCKKERKRKRKCDLPCMSSWIACVSDGMGKRERDIERGAESVAVCSWFYVGQAAKGKTHLAILPSSSMSDNGCVFRH